MKEILIKLKEKLKKDYIECLNDWQKQSKKRIINQAYSIATVNNFYDALLYFIEEYDDEFPIEKDLLEILLNYKDNMLFYFEKQWLNYNHPEYLQFWYDYSDVIDIIKNSIEQLKGEENE